MEERGGRVSTLTCRYPPLIVPLISIVEIRGALRYSLILFVEKKGEIEERGARGEGKEGIGIFKYKIYFIN